jgi:hypothetical protein
MYYDAMILRVYVFLSIICWIVTAHAGYDELALGRFSIRRLEFPQQESSWYGAASFSLLWQLQVNRTAYVCGKEIPFWIYYIIILHVTGGICERNLIDEAPVH